MTTRADDDRSAVTATSVTSAVGESDGESEGESTDPGRIDGPIGWFVVASCFGALFVVFGIAYSFGAFFDSMADEFDASRGSTALVFAITTFLYFALGIPAGRVADRVGPRPVVLFGAVSLVLGVLLTSIVDRLWLGYLTYGLGVGIGVACCYVPMVAAVGGWFDQRRTTALGVSVCGIGLGTLVALPFAAWLIERYGWRNAYVVLALSAGVILGLVSLAAHRPPRSSAERPPHLAPILTSRPFVALYGSMFLASLVMFVPLVFLVDYAGSVGLPSRTAAVLVGVIGASSIFGRLALGALGARVALLSLYRVCLTVIAISFGLWIVADANVGVLALYAVVMGVGYGGFIALAPSVAALEFGTEGLGGILGALYSAAGVGGLIGPPAAGQLIDSLGYRATLVTSLVLGLTAVAPLFALGRPGRQPASAQ